MFCPQCGKKNEATANFCKYCGSALSTNNKKEGSKETSTSHTPHDLEVSKNKKNRMKYITIGIITTIFILSGIYLQFRNIFPKGENTTSKDSDNIYTEREEIDISISQIDNAAFPEVTLYAKIEPNNEKEEFKAQKKDYTITELYDGKEHSVKVTDLIPIEASNEMNINLVLDQSGSMSEDNKIDNAKYAAKEFLAEILKSAKNSVEITSFDDYVYNVQPFTSNETDLELAIDSIEPDGQTALLDAIYDALIQTNQKKGSRIVIAFTDGAENASLHSQKEVVELARLTGIPVFIIGIGLTSESSAISNFAESCNGEYYSTDASVLSEELLKIYAQIYQTQRNLYKITYRSKADGVLTNYRKVVLKTNEKAPYNGTTQLDYMPKDSIANLDNAKLLSIISNRTDAENVAVAIVDLKTDLEYRVGNARKSYVASGFYAPIYIVAGDNNKSVADEMMSGMDNGAGNTLIDSFGGLNSINDALSSKGYTQTIFKRKFGDVQASKAGHENYTSAVDSAKILKDIYKNDGYRKMQWDLTKDGITLPKDTTFYAHRGQGIGAAYNVFAIVTSKKATYGIAIMTAHTGSSNSEAKEVAVPMISEILAEVHQEMVGD